MSEICCRLDAFDGPDERARHQALLRRVHGLTTATRDVPGGLRFALAPDAAGFVDAAAWVTLERRCCPFLAFGLAWDGETPSLTVTGPTGAADLVRDALATA